MKVSLKTVTGLVSVVFLSTAAYAEPVIKYAKSKPVVSKTKVVSAVVVQPQLGVNKFQVHRASQQVTQPITIVSKPVAQTQSTQSALSPLPKIEPMASIQPISAMKPLAPLSATQAPAAATKNTTPTINTLSTSKVMVQPIAALTPIQTTQAVKKDSVSPLGKFLAGAFAWVDSLVEIKPVKPWQKSILAEPVMSAAGINPEHTKFTKKVFISKEASSGGDGVAGGGCGCK